MRYHEIFNEDLTDTDAFRRWFGASKIVDSAGRPMRLYHGTTHPNIQKFEVGYNSSGNKNYDGNHKVISFSTDPKFASNYAGEPVQGRSPLIYVVYIRSVNPGDFRNPLHVEQVKAYRLAGMDRWYAEVKISHPHVWTPDKIEADRNREIERMTGNLEHGVWTFWEDPNLWKRMGWDGAWSREEPNHPNGQTLNFAVADGRQVKSAIGNNGAFRSDTANLTETNK